MKINSSKTNILLLIIFLFLSACQEKREINPALTTAAEEELKIAVHQVMLEWYLWNSQVPQEIDYNAYVTATDLLNAMKNQQYDRWSYIDSAEEYFAFFNSGQYAGHGFGIRWDANNQLWVSFVYNNSPAANAGLKRSDKILKINGQEVASIQNISEALGANEAGVSNTFEVQTSTGEIKSVTISKTEVSINTVLHREVKTVAGKKVGYLVFNSFLETSRTELKTVFDFFVQEGVEELIVDLRYNGGGRVSIASYLGSIIAPNSAQGQTFITYAHNPDKVAEDIDVKFETPDVKLNIKRVIFLTTSSSASASELLINGLRPYMPVVLIGENTFGKPVGSYAFEYRGFVIVPISLRIINSQGVADYYDGLPVDVQRTDDLSLAWGDENDPSLKEALHYIQNNSFSPTLRNRTVMPSPKNKFLYQSGLREEIGAF